MKKILLVITIMLLTNIASLQAATPNWFSYQGWVQKDGENLTSTSETFTFTLKKADNTQVWIETQSLPVSNGLFVAKLGKTTAFGADIFEEELYLTVTLSGENIVVHEPLSAVPYTLGGASTASNTSYTHDDYSNVQDALDSLLNPLSVTISGGGTYEEGASVASTTLTWSINKTPTSVKLYIGSTEIHDAGTTASGNFTYSTAVTADTTFKVEAVVGGKTTTKTTSVSFQWRKYWGFSTKQASDITLADLQALTNSGTELTSSRAKTMTVQNTSGSNKYFIYAFVDGGSASGKFFLNNNKLTGWGADEAEVFVNAEGKAPTKWYIYSSPNTFGAGENKIEVQ